MDLPEAAQQLQGRLRQRHEAILVALGIADMHPRAFGIDIAHLQSQAFAQAQAQTVEREKEHPVTERAGGGEDALGLLHRDDVRQTLGLGRFDQTGSHPGFAQDMGEVELEAVQIEFDRAPGMRGQQIGEVIGQLRFGQTLNLIVEILADAANGAGVGLDRLGSKPLSLRCLRWV